MDNNIAVNITEWLGKHPFILGYVLGSAATGTIIAILGGIKLLTNLLNL